MVNMVIVTICIIINANVFIFIWYIFMVIMPA